MHITGSIQTSQDYTDDFASTKNENFTNLKSAIESEIESILELNSFVMNAVVSVTDILPSSSNLKKRSTGKAIVEFISTCSYRVPKIEDMNAIESNITNTIRNADSTLYKSFDDDSFLQSSFKLSFAEPKIIEFEPPTDAEVMEKIGLDFNFDLNYSFCSAFMENIEKPGDLESIYTQAVNDTSKCQGSSLWSGWNSAVDPIENNGDDYETLHDHQILFG